MSLLSKEQLLAADSRKVEDVRIDALGGDLRIREMSTKQRLKIQEYNDKKQTDNAIAYSLSVSLIDEHGEPLLSFAEVQGMLGTHGAVIDEITQAIAKLNGINLEETDAEKN